MYSKERRRIVQSKDHHTTPPAQLLSAWLVKRPWISMSSTC